MAPKNYNSEYSELVNLTLDQGPDNSELDILTLSIKIDSDKIFSQKPYFEISLKDFIKNGNIEKIGNTNVIFFSENFCKSFCRTVGISLYQLAFCEKENVLYLAKSKEIFVEAFLKTSTLNYKLAA